MQGAAGGGVVAPNFYLTGFNQLASPNHICWRGVVDGQIQGNALTNCSAAFGPRRDKEDLVPFTEGLNIIKRLAPMAFKWKADGTRDIGLNAEDVAQIEPTLVTLNAQGEADNIKEHSLDVLFINAIKEQQSQIETQKARIEAQQQSIRLLNEQVVTLKRLFCLGNPTAAECGEFK
jgi:hypothetical protein